MAKPSQKRAPDVMEEGPPMKLLRPDGSMDSEAWVCSSCGNENYGSRHVCNMRKCGAPRSPELWTCPGCGNSNYANRLFCNMRKCQLARPGLTAGALKQHIPGPMKNAAIRAPSMLALAMPRQPRMDSNSASPGSWTCPSCGNQNYAGRDTCNMRKCGKPMPTTSFEMSSGPIEMSSGPIPRFELGRGGARAGGKGGGPPPGSWSCAACNNMNYPNRTVCNARNCGQPRALVEDVVESRPEPDMDRSIAAAPPGSWVCPDCANVNYPQRTACNKRGCGKPRPEE